MATPKQLREVAQDAARELRRAQGADDGVVEQLQRQADAANVALHDATGTSVDAAGTVVSGFPDQLRVEGHVSLPQGVAESRLRLREAGIDTEDLDDATVTLRERLLEEQEREQAITDLVGKHTPRKVIGADDPSPEDLRDILGEIGHREQVGAVLNRDPTTLTPADFAEFERRSGHDAVIDAVLGSDLTPVQLAQARSALRNQEFDARVAVGRIGATEPATTPPADPGADDVPDGSPPVVDDGDPAPTPGSPGDDTPDNGDPATPPPDDAAPAPAPGNGGSTPPAEPPPPGDSAPGPADDTGAAPSGSTFLGRGTLETDDPALDGQPVDLYEDADGNLFAVADDGTVHPISGAVDDTTGAPVDPRVVSDGGDTTTTPDPPPADPPPADPPPETPPADPPPEEAPADPPPADPPPADPPPADPPPADPPPADPPPEEPPPDDTPSTEIDGDPEGPDGSDLPDGLRLDFTRPGIRPKGSGVTDPPDDAVEVRDPSVSLPTHAELGRTLFGNPGTAEGVGLAGGGANVNPGANSHGAGVTDPAEDQDLSVGSGPEDDPFADAGGVLEPVAEADDDDGGGLLTLAPSDIEGPVDDGPDLPDLDADLS